MQTIPAQDKVEQDANRFHNVLDQAERYGRQLAWLNLDTTLEWQNEINIRHAWSTFIDQFPQDVHQYIRGAFQDGYMRAWCDVLFAQRISVL